MSATRPPTGAARAPATSQANTGRPPNAKDLSRQVGGTRATARWDAGTALTAAAHLVGPRSPAVSSPTPSGYAFLFDRAEPVQASQPAAETRRGFRLANLLLELMKGAGASRPSAAVVCGKRAETREAEQDDRWQGRGRNS